MSNIFGKNMTLIAALFPKLRTVNAMAISIPKKCCFKGSVEMQHGKWAKTLFKFEGHLVYHIY